MRSAGRNLYPARCHSMYATAGKSATPVVLVNTMAGSNRPSSTGSPSCCMRVRLLDTSLDQGTRQAAANRAATVSAASIGSRMAMRLKA